MTRQEHAGWGLRRREEIRSMCSSAKGKCGEGKEERVAEERKGRSVRNEMPCRELSSEQEAS